MTDTPTLGRAASLRVAYASACQDVAMLRKEVRELRVERDALSRYIAKQEDAELHADKYFNEAEAATARAEAAEAEVVRLRAFVAEEGVICDSEMIGADVRCLACKERAYYKDNVQHKEDCIVLAAIKAQKEAPRD